MADRSIEELVEKELQYFNDDPEILSGYDSATIDAVNQHAESKKIAVFTRDLISLILRGRVKDAVRLIVSERFPAALVREENAFLRGKLEKMRISVDDLEKRLKLALTDELTSLPSRRVFNSDFLRELARLKRYGGEIALLFCDIDYFKNINDTYGHEGGDQVLKKVAALMKEIFYRPTDYLCRFGGEELVVCLVNCNLDNAGKKADEFRRAVEKIPADYGKLSISIGCSHLDKDRLELLMKSPDGADILKTATKAYPEQKDIAAAMTAAKLLLAEADGLVYRAKQNGRNRVEASTDFEDLLQLRRNSLDKKSGNGNGNGNGK